MVSEFSVAFCAIDRLSQGYFDFFLGAAAKERLLFYSLLRRHFYCRHATLLLYRHNAHPLRVKPSRICALLQFNTVHALFYVYDSIYEPKGQTS